MRWYVIQVKSGTEMKVRDELLLQRFPAKVPREVVPILKSGKWIEKEKTLLPGYVFVGTDELDAALYYAATGVKEVIRFLGTPPQPISHLEAEHLALLAPTNAPVGLSQLAFRDDGYQVVSGPLLALSSQITKVERRQRKVQVRIPVLGEDKIITLGISATEGGANDD